MKFFKKRSVAILVMAAAIVLSSLYGLSRAPALRIPEGGPALDTALSTVAYEVYIVDEAKVLSAKTEKNLSLYNANWDQWAGSILSVVTVKDVPISMEDAAWEWVNHIGLGDNDALLLLCTGTKDAYFFTSGNFYDAVGGRETTYLSAYVYEGVQRGDYDAAAENLFGAINLLFADAASAGGGSYQTVSLVIPLIVLILLLVILFSLLDSIRFSSWRRRTMGMPYPPVYRPILWWHGPRSSWYRRRHNPPPPPPPPSRGPRPPMGGGSFGSSGRTGGGGFSRSGGSFGSSGRTSGGGFSRGGGSFGSSGRTGRGGFSRGGGRR